MRSTPGVMCHDITVRPAIQGTDPYGNPTRTYASGTVYRGRAWMTAGRVEEKYRETAVETWWVILPPEAQVSPHDRIEHEGRSFDVEEVMPRLGYATIHHLTVRMTRVEGFS